MSEQQEVMNATEAAAFLRLHPSTVSRMVARGRIPHRMIGRAPRFSRTVLLEWLRGKDEPAEPTTAPTAPTDRVKPKHVRTVRAESPILELARRSPR